MFNHFRFAYRLGMTALVLLLLSGTGWGADEGGGGEGPAARGATPGQTETPLQPEGIELTGPETESVPLEAHTVMDAYAGYRFISVNDFGGRAAEYEYLHSEPVLGGFVNHLGQDHKFSLEGGYLNDKDFRGEAIYDYRGIYRFNLRSEALFHNLDHEQLFSPSFSLNGNSYTPVDLDPGQTYGVKVEQDLAQFRYKFALFPVHLNLGYWHYRREGSNQLRFADQAFEGASNTIYAKRRGVDYQTHEGRFGLDTHLGLIDVIYDFRFRQFGDHNAIPRDLFVDRLDPREVMPRFGGVLEHNEAPDSRFYSHTVRLHTSLSGGVVGAASYTYAKRDNLSGLTDFGGARQASNTLHNVAGDFSYTPCHFFSLAVRYRRQDVERSGPLSLTASGTLVANPPVAVRPAPDTQKDIVTTTLMLRPSALVTVKGEYRGEILSRTNNDVWYQPGKVSTIAFPDRSETHTGTIALLGRPWKGFKFKTEYRYSVSDHPAYADGYEQKHEGSALVSYNAPNRWGITANGRITSENRDDPTIATLDLINPSEIIPVPRNKKTANTTVSLWFVPVGRLTITGSYGLLRSSIDQTVLFQSPTPDRNTVTNYTNQAQIFSVQGVYHWDERLDLSLILQQVRSYAEFDPQSTATVDVTGVKQLTRVDTVESSLAARADYHFTRNFSCGIEYAFRDYSDNNALAFLYNGSVNIVTAQVAAKW